MAEQTGDDAKALASACRDRRVGMAKVVDVQPVQPRRFTDQLPRELLSKVVYELN